jgi:hypothetical protein
MVIPAEMRSSTHIVALNVSAAYFYFTTWSWRGGLCRLITLGVIAGHSGSKRVKTRESQRLFVVCEYYMHST